jgi:lysozyme
MQRSKIFDAVRQMLGRPFTDAEVKALDAAIDASVAFPTRTVSQKCLDLIRTFEGLRLQAYLDTGNVPTIGVGHTKGVKMGQTITEAQADQFLREDLSDAEEAVRRMFPVTTQGQYDALVSFTFNLGEGQVSDSTLRKLHNAGDYAGAKLQFARWSFDNGKRLRGLERRRSAEAELYAS